MIKWKDKYSAKAHMPVEFKFTFQPLLTYIDKGQGCDNDPKVWVCFLVFLVI